ncbi:MAG: 3-dehydroquinate synthase [Actinobacteria bacterium]|nr:3-dehydroquinate synthase [Actinomycetota bacterium]
MKLVVDLQDKSYPIYIKAGALQSLAEILYENNLTTELFVITDENVQALYGEKVLTILRKAGLKPTMFSVPAGENSKSLQMADFLYSKLIENRATRKSTILALGGGVVGDLAGFVAATFMRGVKFVQIPTTLLSQVDSSVGGKVGVNHRLGKNLIGAFYQPVFVLIDPDVLQTLPQKERRAGMAEVIKYSFIRDVAFYETLNANLATLLDLGDAKLTESVLARCCSIKANVVEKDEREGGLRAILNFGHTIGHALEALTAYGTFLHGEAILHGMRGAVHLSLLENKTTRNEKTRALSLIDKLDPPSIPKSISIEGVLDAMTNDKKRTTEGQLWVLLREIGKVELARQVNDRNVREAIRFVLDYPG